MPNPPRPSPSIQQRGLTLVELLVAMALSLLVVMAAVAALTYSRQGFRSVDASSQLRDNARFAESIMRRIILQGGFLNTKYAVNLGSDFKTSSTVEEPNIKGFDNAKYTQDLATGVTTASPSNGINGSDLLIVRYQSGDTNSGAPASAPANQTMINCSGGTVPDAFDGTERMASVFHINTSATTGEPTLMCSFNSFSSGAWTWSTQPLIDGVETLQILYGVDGVTAGAAPTASETIIPVQYLRANQLIVSGNEPATIANWKRVRTIRVGMVLRGPPGSAPEQNVPAQYPLGTASMPLSVTGDTGSTLAAQTDGRLRQTVTFTVHLRNPQDNI